MNEKTDADAFSRQELIPSLVFIPSSILPVTDKFVTVSHFQT